MINIQIGEMKGCKDVQLIYSGEMDDVISNSQV
jgi:hypothetical protein